MNTLEGYAGTALLQGEAVILIATGGHLQAVAERLSAQGFDLRALRASGKFHPLDARAVLNKFMVDGMPDSKLFFSVIGKVIRKSHGAAGRIRAFGEMVVLLWEEGNQKAALKLEQIWNLFMEQYSLTLLCAYPSSILGKAGLKSVCCAHSKQIGGWPHASTEVFYK